MKPFLLVSLLACHAQAWASETFSVRIGGRETPVIEHRVEGRLNCAYAHFIANGPADVAVTMPAGARRWTLSPLHDGIAATADAGVIRFHLAKGAVLQGNARAEDYAEYPKTPGKTGISALIRIEDAKQVRVFGHGTVDARGFTLAGNAATIEEVRLKARCFTIERSRHVTIEGLICREATSWTVPFLHCADVAVRRVKVINDLGPLEHSDGINLCAT